MPKARTFDQDGKPVEVEVLGPPSSTGLCKVKLGEKTLVRHKDRLTALDEESKKLLRPSLPGSQ